MDAALRLSPQDALRQARSWGWPFAAGLAGLAMAAVISLLVVPRVKREAIDVSDSVDRIARLAPRPASGATSARAIEPGPERFIASFPPADARQARVASTLELAVRHSLAVRRSEFQLSRDKATGLLRYSVTMPLSGPYAQVRGFVEDALAGDAALSLDRMRLRRASPAANGVDADLTWSFYMRPGSAAASGVAR